MIHLIQEIKTVTPFCLTLRFNTGEIIKVNLEQQLRAWSQSPQSKFRELLEPNYFRSVKLNHEIGAVYWDNGLDFCPDVLYQMGVVENNQPFSRFDNVQYSKQEVLVAV